MYFEEGFAKSFSLISKGDAVYQTTNKRDYVADLWSSGKQWYNKSKGKPIDTVQDTTTIVAPINDTAGIRQTEDGISFPLPDMQLQAVHSSSSLEYNPNDDPSEEEDLLLLQQVDDLLRETE